MGTCEINEILGRYLGRAVTPIDILAEARSGERHSGEERGRWYRNKGKGICGVDRPRMFVVDERTGEDIAEVDLRESGRIDVYM